MIFAAGGRREMFRKTFQATHPDMMAQATADTRFAMMIATVNMTPKVMR